jgi:transcriptional regulator with XRE-family HTH domain
MTLRWLAKETGLSNPFLSQLENGRTSPSAESLSRLADVFGFTMDELWRGVGRLSE